MRSIRKCNNPITFHYKMQHFHYVPLQKATIPLCSIVKCNKSITFHYKTLQFHYVPLQKATIPIHSITKCNNSITFHYKMLPFYYWSLQSILLDHSPCSCCRRFMFDLFPVHDYFSFLLTSGDKWSEFLIRMRRCVGQTDDIWMTLRGIMIALCGLLSHY